MRLTSRAGGKAAAAPARPPPGANRTGPPPRGLPPPPPRRWPALSRVWGGRQSPLLPPHMCLSPCPPPFSPPCAPLSRPYPKECFLTEKCRVQGLEPGGNEGAALPSYTSGFLFGVGSQQLSSGAIKILCLFSFLK